MLQVKTTIDKSNMHGIGLYAAQFIPKGTVTWEYTPEFDNCYPLDCIKRMPKHIKKRFLDYSYIDYKQNKYVLCFDDQRFINHSNKPNIKSTPNMDVALRDIKKGEEMTCNYEDYEKNWFKKRGLKKSSFKPIS